METEKFLCPTTELQKLIQFEPLRGGNGTTLDKADAKPSLTEKVCEREALVILMNSINNGLQHQENLITALEKVDEYLEKRQETPMENLAPQVEAERLWLQNCVRQTGEMVDKLLSYLQLFYGSAYLPPE